MNVGKLMARLNPKSMPLQFTGARGSSPPELTPIDIAGAMGAAGGSPVNRLAVEVLCLRWWPARFDGPTTVIGTRPVKHANPGGKPYIEHVSVEAPSETPAFARIVSVVERFLSTAADQVPLAVLTKPGLMGRWSRAVIAEYRQPHHCHQCQHFGQPGQVPKLAYTGKRITGVTWLLCDVCDGTGTLAWGSERRAKALRIRKQTFIDSGLGQVQDQALRVLRELESRGARRIAKNLRES